MTTVTSTFTASNGTQSETLVHEFNVTAAASPGLVQQAASPPAGSTDSSWTATLPAKASAGNTLLLVMRDYTGSTPTPPAGFTLFATVNPSGSSRPIKYYRKTADGTEQAITATIPSADSQPRGIAVQEWEGSVTFSTPAGVYLSTYGSPQTCGPTSAPPSATAVPSMFIFNSNPGSNFSATWPSGWVATNQQNTGSALAVTNIGSMAIAPNAAVSPSLTFSSTGSWMYWMNVWVDKA